jgi:putative transcriptional regulator
MRHPDVELLLRRAAGNMDGTEDLLIAAHESLCTHCAGVVAGFETIFGATLEALEPSALAPGVICRAVGALEKLPQDSPRMLVSSAEPSMPLPLRRHFGDDLATVTWQQLSPEAWLSERRIRQGKALAVLLKIDGGGHVPAHRHKGYETLLVLEGNFTDEQGRHKGGDVVRFAPGSTHHAAAPEGPCICLLVISDELEFTEPLWPETVNSA